MNFPFLNPYLSDSDPRFRKKFTALVTEYPPVTGVIKFRVKLRNGATMERLFSRPHLMVKRPTIFQIYSTALFYNRNYTPPNTTFDASPRLYGLLFFFPAFTIYRALLTPFFFYIFPFPPKHSFPFFTCLEGRIFQHFVFCEPFFLLLPNYE